MIRSINYIRRAFDKVVESCKTKDPLLSVVYRCENGHVHASRFEEYGKPSKTIECPEGCGAKSKLFGTDLFMSMVNCSKVIVWFRPELKYVIKNRKNESLTEHFLSEGLDYKIEENECISH